MAFTSAVLWFAREPLTLSAAGGRGPSHLRAPASGTALRATVMGGRRTHCSDVQSGHCCWPVLPAHHPFASFASAPRELTSGVCAERFQSLHGRRPAAERGRVLCGHGSLGSAPTLLAQELPDIRVAVILRGTAVSVSREQGGGLHGRRPSTGPFQASPAAGAEVLFAVWGMRFRIVGRFHLHANIVAYEFHLL